MKSNSGVTYHKMLSLYILVPSAAFFTVTYLNIKAAFLIFAAAPVIVYGLIRYDSSLEISNKRTDALNIVISSYFAFPMFAWHFFKHLEKDIF